MIFKNDSRNIKQEVFEIDSALQTLEVKGESVMVLAFVRQKLKILYESTIEVEEEKKKED